jgi:dipeptidyl aminopeptidase/acylaminoacyl peptidase
MTTTPTAPEPQAGLEQEAADQAATTTDQPATEAPTPFHDLEAFVGLPRIGGLALSPDGTRLVATVQTLDAKKSGYVSALWELDPAGEAPARRLTRGAKGESGAAFTREGDLLFTAGRPGTNPGDEHDDSEVPALWLLPRAGGEARLVARRAGGVGGLTVAREAGTVLLASGTHPLADEHGDDTEVVKARKESKVSAILHETYPVRYWDHDLGPAGTRLFTATPTDVSALAAEADPRLDLTDLTGHVPGRVDDRASWDISPDGRTVVVDWTVPEAKGDRRVVLATIDVVSREVTVVADDAEVEHEGGRFSPDGSQIAVTLFRRSTPHRAPDVSLGLLPAGGGEVRDLTPDWDLWPGTPRWTPDGSALVVAADEQGRSPLYRVDVSTGERTRLTTDDGAYASYEVSADGQWVYALRSAIDSPAAPVRVPIGGGAPQPIPSPVPAVEVPGTLTEVTTTAEDGTPLRAWLALPEGASADSPAPLLLWIHGGPLGSWNAWTWRWNPWTATARGYAVLLPDPRLSTGYGQEFIEKGWGAWGAAPYTDLMAITDATVARDDVDEERTAAMGGSFGGYMANWVAGHTDRFRCIVTHASLWALDNFGLTTDAAYYWLHELTDEMAQANSPHHHVDAITTPMLVVHGDKDYRVPINEGLRLWYELVARSADENGETPHRFLYFPDENHWILTPNNSRAWYATVFAFLDQHVLGKDWVRPEELR